MAGINKVILVGNLGKDPEIRSLESGSKKASFSLATSEWYKNKEGQKIEQTEWHNIVIWRPALVEVAEKYLKKGSQIFLEGKIRTNSWEDKEGNKKSIIEIIADNFTMLGAKKEREESPQQLSESEVTPPVAPSPDDDLPF